MVPLPIDPFLPEIVALLRTHRCLVLVAEPGAGKTTRVPPALAKAQGLLDAPAIVMLQPRRVAARAAAERIAEENAWRVGHEVGYHVRFERRIGPDTRIRVLTEAILSRQLLSDPELAGVGAVLLDEFHERSIHCDLALSLLREVQESLRPDLRIVVMSATLDAEPVSRFLGDCPILRVPGRTFPVDITHHAPLGAPRRPEELAVDTAESVLRDAAATNTDPGHLLCFLPGAEEIRRAVSQLSARLGRPDHLDILPLHGTLPFEEQRRAIQPSARRKVLFATNIAETSLTIDGVRTVIDTGLSRQTRYDPRRGLERLELGRISKASATQRSGRAGRTAPGQCIRLWSAREHAELPDFDPPELHRVDLAATLLLLMCWGVRDTTAFGWFEPPAPDAVATSLRLLTLLGAIEPLDTSHRVTDLGRRMGTLPLHPRLARLLIDALDAHRLDEGLTLAALLSERDIRLRNFNTPHHARGPTETANSDLTPRLELLEHAQRRGLHPSLESDGIDVVTARAVLRTRDELRSRLAGQKPDPRRRLTSPDLVLSAYPDRVCLRRTSDPSAGLMVGGIGVVLAPESAVRTAPLFLALDAREDDRARARQAAVSLAHAITLDQLRAAFPHALTRNAACLYDEAKDKVVGRIQTRYHDLVLEETDDARVEDRAAAEALADALLPNLSDRLTTNDKAANLLARLTLVARHVPPPEGRTWPAPPWEPFRDDLIAHLASRAARRLADFDAPAFLQSLLTWPLDRLLEEHAPARWTVPTGNAIAIDYTAPSPVLAVRLQEMFGATTTPRICNGKVPLVLHLLSPGYKPVQITQDLVSFWSTTYEQVRKDLRARYPKHAWPDNPLTAPPVAKGRSSR